MPAKKNPRNLHFQLPANLHDISEEEIIAMVDTYTKYFCKTPILWRDVTFAVQDVFFNNKDDAQVFESWLDQRKAIEHNENVVEKAKAQISLEQQAAVALGNAEEGMFETRFRAASW